MEGRTEGQKEGRKKDGEGRMMKEGRKVIDGR
jgi:hypothetical protein